MHFKSIFFSCCFLILSLFNEISVYSAPRRTMQQEIEELVLNDMKNISLGQEKTPEKVVVTFLKPLGTQSTKMSTNLMKVGLK